VQSPTANASATRSAPRASRSSAYFVNGKQPNPFLSPSSPSASIHAEARGDVINNDTDWTKKKISHASLVQDTALTNGHPSKRHATLPTRGAAGGEPVVARRRNLRGKIGAIGAVVVRERHGLARDVAVQVVAFEGISLDCFLILRTGFSLHMGSRVETRRRFHNLRINTAFNLCASPAARRARAGSLSAGNANQ
jgi:hypothetical protein